MYKVTYSSKFSNSYVHFQTSKCIYDSACCSGHFVQSFWYVKYYLVVSLINNYTI